MLSDCYQIRQHEASVGSLGKSILCCGDKKEELDKGNEDSITHSLRLALLACPLQHTKQRSSHGKAQQVLRLAVKVVGTH